jgi:hypothetical protein
VYLVDCDVFRAVSDILQSGTTKKITSAQDSEQKILMYFLKNKSA